MKRSWGRMTYDGGSGRWVVHTRGQEWGFHCGEGFLMRVGEQMEISCRIEMDHDWYVIMGDVRFYLKENDTYFVLV